LLEPGDDPPRPLEPLALERGERRLTVRFLAAGAADEQSLLLFQEQAELSAAALAPLGLTPRESKVLLWAARGKTDADIANMLVLSRRSMQAYLQHIYRNLQVSGRTAAAARAFEALRSV
jgi:DNA-binding NarL/FixJ family response regulator